MTCIVGLEHEGKVYMGGDSAAVSGLDYYRTSLKKVFINKNFIIGYTSSFRMGQLLEYNLSVREKYEDEDDLKYMVMGFIPCVRTCLKDGGYAKIKENEEIGGSFLVGYNGKLYHIDPDFQVNRNSDGFNSVGCAESFVLGSLHVMDKKDPEIAINKALEIAEKCSCGVKSPFYMLSL